MDAGKEIIFLERRAKAAKNTTIIFTDTSGFLTLIAKAAGGLVKLDNIKYFGKVTSDKIGDSCTCQSFYHGNSDKWRADHGYSYQCKHIINAREARGW